MSFMKNSLFSKGKQFLNIIKPKTRLGLASWLFILSICCFFIFIAGNNAFAIDVGGAILEAIGDLFLWIAAKFMQLTMFILRFVIEIASYNGYINSTAVGLGWVLVRDIANMFFVIILMLIAFGTVLGLEQYEWKKLIVKFVLAAILVNFSRIICGVIIDAAQVFMMTFISGVAAVGGGNIINALQMSDTVSFSKSVSPDQMTSGNMVASAMFAAIFAFASMVIMAAYLVVLLARVIALWVLIILSPLAFVLGIVPKFRDYAGQWWSEFTNNVIIGPVLAFFLWLAFAVAGGGTAYSEISEHSQYSMGKDLEAEMAQAERGGGSNLNKFMENETLASFLIAFALLMAGVKVGKKLGAAGSEILGQAGGLAMKGAAVMTGITAAKWGGRKAVAGAKKAGKFAAMKMPVVGGDAWVRRGKSIKAGAKEKYHDIASYREKFAADMLKSGEKGEKSKGIGGLARRALGRASLTTAQKEKLVQFKEGAAEDARKERMEKLGMGGTKMGFHAGERKMRAEIASEDASRDAKLGLGQAKINAYQKLGRPDDASIAEATLNRMRHDYEAKKNDQLDYGGKLSKARELSLETKDLRDKLLDALSIGDERMVDRLSEQLSENAVSIMNLQTSASTDVDTRKAVDDVVRKHSGSTFDFDAHMTAEDSSAAQLCKITGLDASSSDQQELLHKISQTMEQKGTFQSAAMHLSEADSKLFRAGGGLEYSSLSSGLDVDKNTGRLKAVYGFGSNVGSYDIKGSERAAGETRDALKSDQNKINYFTNEIRPTYHQNSNVDVVIGARDKQGNVEKLNTAQLESIGNYLSNVSGIGMKRALHSKFVQDLNKLAQEGKLDQAKASEILDQLKSKLTDEKQRNALDGLLGDVVAKAGRGGSRESTANKGQPKTSITRESQLEGIEFEE